MKTYLERLMIALPHLISKGQMYFPEIQHDDWCKINKGKDCNCKPFVFIETENGRFEIDKNGKHKKVV